MFNNIILQDYYGAPTRTACTLGLAHVISWCLNSIGMSCVSITRCFEFCTEFRNVWHDVWQRVEAMCLNDRYSYWGWPKYSSAVWSLFFYNNTQSGFRHHQSIAQRTHPYAEGMGHPTPTRYIYLITARFIPCSFGNQSSDVKATAWYKNVLVMLFTYSLHLSSLANILINI